MDVIQLQAVEASLLDPNDPAEVTLVADVVGVGKTHRLATGQIVTWTAAFLRQQAHTFIGKPVNIDLNEDGQPSGHSRRVIGTITAAFFDEAKQVITVHAALWRHYAPLTVARIKELGAKKLQVSMELIPRGEMQSNEDGSVTPIDGEFTGMGIVRVGADPQNRVILVAALAEDDQQRSTPTPEDDATFLKRLLRRLFPDEVQAEGHCVECDEVHAAPMSTDTRNSLPDSSFACPSERKYPVKHKDGSIDMAHLRNALARVADPNNDQCGKEVIMRLAKQNGIGASAQAASDAPDDDTVISASEDTGAADEEHDVPDNSEELRAALRAELREEFEAELAALTAERDELKAAAEQREADEAADRLATERAAELEAILPSKSDEAKARRLTTLRTLSAEAFDALKAELAEAAEFKGALHSEGNKSRDAGSEDEIPEEQMAGYLEEAQAAFGVAATK